MVERKQNWVKALSNAVNLATSVAAAIFIGLLGGKWLDGRFDIGFLSGYFFTIIGFLFGILTAGKMMWERLMEDNGSSTLIQDEEDEK